MPPLSSSTLPEVAGPAVVPAYDRARVRASVVHVGVGGFHRSHQAWYHDRLLHRDGTADWGILGAGVLRSDERMADALGAQDGLYALMAKAPDGGRDVRVIGSLVGYLWAPDDPEPLLARLADPGTRIASLTVTEGGYTPDNATFALLAAALGRRRDAGVEPFTVMSCDNLEDNGTRARDALLARTEDAGLRDWIAEHGRFPQSMVDRITPATTDADRDELRERFDIEDRWPVVCEPFAQWVLEDAFACGRPPYEDAGVQVVEDVRPFELMKLRLLNGGHQALAYLGLLAGYTRVDEAASDDAFQEFLRRYQEDAARTLPDVPGTDLGEYAATLRERFANPAVGDTLARLAEHGSDRLPPWVVPVAADALRAGRDVRPAATVVAGWCAFCARGDVVDARADELVAAAREGGDAFLRVDGLFGDLPGDERFTDAFAGALRSLEERGAPATVASAAA